MKTLAAGITALSALLGLIPLSGASAGPSPDAPGTSVPYTQSQQVMVAHHVGGTKGTWTRYQWEGATMGWVKLATTGQAIFGIRGVVNGKQRVQGDDKTPLGTYPIEYAFGIGNPGTTMPYRTVDACSVWDVNPRTTHYNRWVETCTRKDLGERLADYTASQFRQAAVIGYNYVKPVHGRGAGIFLHYASSYTRGCVGLNDRTELQNTITWMDPAQHPTIVIT